MASPELVVTARRALTPVGIVPASIWIRDGRIEAVTAPGTPPPGCPVLDAGERVVLPGFVDTHVHVNAPGRSTWEGFESATDAAAAGGVTTLVDMPLNSVPVTTTPTALEAKRRAARRRCRVDVGFWGGLVPGNADALPALAAAGVLGFKAFLSDSGIPEFPAVTPAEIAAAAPRFAATGLPLLVHAEAPEALGPLAPGERRYRAFLRSRPPRAERRAVADLLELAAAARLRLHVVHVAAAGALELLARARRRGVAVTAETCPHYLTFEAGRIEDGDTRFKCAPPIRGRHHRRALWRALGNGTLDLVASDHSPSPPAGKALESGDLEAAWGGVSSLEIAPAAVWTGMRRRGLPLELLARWLCEAPAALAGLGDRKGRLAVGYDADLVFWDPAARFAVDGARLHHRHPLTPYQGMRLWGRSRTTLVRGQVVWDGQRFVGPRRGRLLSR